MKKLLDLLVSNPSAKSCGYASGNQCPTNGNASISKAFKRGNLEQLPTGTAQTFSLDPLQFDDIHIFGIVSRGAVLDLHYLHSSAAEQTA